MPNYNTTWCAVWEETFYTSATLVADGDSGIVATPLAPASGKPAVFPLSLRLTAANITVAETVDVTIIWYMNATGAGGALSTTTFAQATAGAPTPPLELWPGDVAASFDAATFLKPLPPYCKITWDISAAASLNITIYLSYLQERP